MRKILLVMQMLLLASCNQIHDRQDFQTSLPQDALNGRIGVYVTPVDLKKANSNSYSSLFEVSLFYETGNKGSKIILPQVYLVTDSGLRIFSKDSVNIEASTRRGIVEEYYQGSASLGTYKLEPIQHALHVKLPDGVLNPSLIFELKSIVTTMIPSSR